MICTTLTLKHYIKLSIISHPSHSKACQRNHYSSPQNTLRNKTIWTNDAAWPKNLQLSTSSQSKKWGAYFSAVFGWNSVPVSATEAHGHRVCNRLLVFYPPGTFVLPHTCTHHRFIHGCFKQDLFRSRSIGFVCWEIQSTCIWTNPAVNTHVLADAVCMCGAKQKCLVDKKQAAYCRLDAHALL